MLTKTRTDAVKQHLTLCPMCGYEVGKPCDTPGRVRGCERQIKNKLHSGIASDFVRAIMCGSRVLAYAAVSNAKLKDLRGNQN